jgi:Raf kinase inhibitor-like YbhB/YbcL family protein
MSLTVRTPTFHEDGNTPSQFTKDGGNVSPLIEWQGAPAGTKSYALIVEDPDAPKGTFRHWAAYDISADLRRLAEGAGSREQGAAVQMAENDFGHTRYDGPQPPPGDKPHHYHFRLFALDVPELDVADDCSAMEIFEAARAHAIAEADTVGTFARGKR